MKYFGIGCFHFSLKDGKRSDNLKFIDYIDEINSVLSHISNISEITFEYDSSNNYDLSFEDINPKLNRGDYVYPSQDFMSISFKVYIPFRIQAELLETDEEYLDTFTEYFKVDMMYSWYGPYTFIELISPINGDPISSNAVRLVRDFLKIETNSIKSFIEFDCIGPSPFHADFCIIEEKNKSITFDKNHFRVININNDGYDNYIINYRKKYFKNIDIAYEDFKNIISNEISFFYYCVINNVNKIHDLSDINQDMSDLLELERNNKKIKEIIKKPKLLRKIFNKISLFKINDMLSKKEIHNHYKDIYNSNTVTYFNSIAKKRKRETTKYPIDDTIKLLEYIDSKISKKFEFSIIIIAAISGGLVASLINLFAK